VARGTKLVYFRRPAPNPLNSIPREPAGSILPPPHPPKKVQNASYYISFLYVGHQSTKQDATRYMAAGPRRKSYIR
jgi:hypothetical protein